ncbi:MAG: ABC transporter ATP-binding protein [Usitatibacter sp.]
MNALDVRDLRKDFGAVSALRGVSFSVAPGEVFGYLGPNGAGKTTTLRILLGLVRQTAGSASLFGMPSAASASRADIGFLPGDLRLYGDMTAAATLDFFARFRPARPSALRPMLIDALNIDAATLARRVKFLSHGTRQKLGLIVAMQHDPALLLLDEPTNGLDPLVQQAFRAIVGGFAERGRSVLFSSHVLSEVEVVCRRVAILRQGELVALETIENLREKVVRKLTVRFPDAVPPGLRDIAGVARSEVHGREMALWVQGDVNPVLRALASIRVEDVIFPEPQLEDIFLGYYHAERGDG